MTEPEGTAPAVAPGRRAASARRVVAAVARWVRRRPMTTALMAATLVVHALSGTGLGRIPAAVAGAWGYQPADLGGGLWWTMFTSPLLNSGAGTMLLGLVVLGVVLGLAESTVGTVRTAAVFITVQVAAALLFTWLLPLASALELDRPSGLGPAMLLGPAAASVGALMAASQAISLLWRRRIRVLVLAAALMFSMYVGHAQYVFILLGAVSGLVLGRLAIPAVGQGVVGRSTSREVRTNLAVVVAVFAVGPFAAAAAHVAVGPLAVLRGWITGQDEAVAHGLDSCDAAAAACHAVLHNLGSGWHLLALMPMVLQLVCAEGLRRGNRLALWATVYLLLVIGVVSALYFQVFAGVGLSLRKGHHSLTINESVVDLLPVVLVPLAIAVLLLLNRRHFRVDPDPALRRRLLVILPLILLAFLGLYTAAWLAEGNLQASTLGWVSLLAGIPRILLPLPIAFNYSSSVYPRGLFSELLFSFGGTLLWLASAVAILAVFLSRRQHSGPDAAGQARRLVREGGDSLSWMALWPRNQYWFNAEGTAGVAYQPHNGVAVTVGGPIGDQSLCQEAVDGFLDFCLEESLTPCFYSVNEGPAEALERHGHRRIEVASETLLDVQTMDFKGKAWQNIRTALNKAEKLGVEVLWCHYSELSSSQRTQVHEISEDWVSGQALPELGFTLGGLEELKDGSVLLGLAIDAAGKVHAVTSWLPVHSQGAVVGWTLDFMRRDSAAFNGVMEYLIAKAVRHFAQTVETISLSGSPLSGSGGADGGLDRILALLARTLEPVYGFASLAQFKSRFKPRHRTLYLMYRDPLALPAIAAAVGEAYMPELSVRSVARLLRRT
ncbi:DUF2156 domain-containing protein [Arthrobacter sp. HY1533]|uniref:DUF2156 domain-containing protein n=1 Tax=Arthrobacter sp. HY1533 TaxID=2970919 RepID=UPI0022B9FC51|nr:DUF2156 domain-containing protein [Arthrobacter sp. HY1533]